MITESMVYWILALDNIVAMFVVLTIISIISTIIAFFIWFTRENCCYHKDEDKCFKYFIISFVLFIVFLMASTFIPSTKQMAIIKVVPTIANGEITKEIKGDAEEIYKLGIQAIKESLITKNKEE